MDHHQDDDSIISAIYTDSGDASELNHTVSQVVDEDDEEFRRAIEAEQVRVMREFGIPFAHMNNNNDHDAVSIAEESNAGISIAGESYSNILQQLEKPALTHKTSSTPETYNNFYDDDDDDDDDEVDKSKFQPTSLFPSGTYRQMLTPRRLKIAIITLCVIILVSVSIAVGSFFAQDKKGSPLQSNVQFPDLGAMITSSPTTAPIESFTWNEDDCTDHPNKSFSINEEIGDQNCTYLQSDSTQRARLCLQGNEGYRWCRATCGVCQKSDPPSDVPSDVPSAVPTTRPRPESNPIPTPVAQPARQPVPEPTRRPVAAPTRRPVPEPTRRPVSIPAPTPVARRTRRPVPEPTRRPVPEPTRRPVPEPTRRPVPEPTRRPVPEPTRRPVPEPTGRPVPEPTLRPVPEPTPSPARPTGPAPAPFLCRVCFLGLCEFLPCD